MDALKGEVFSVDFQIVGGMQIYVDGDGKNTFSGDSDSGSSCEQILQITLCGQYDRYYLGVMDNLCTRLVLARGEVLRGSAAMGKVCCRCSKDFSSAEGV